MSSHLPSCFLLSICCCVFLAFLQIKQEFYCSIFSHPIFLCIVVFFFVVTLEISVSIHGIIQFILNNYFYHVHFLKFLYANSNTWIICESASVVFFLLIICLICLLNTYTQNILPSFTFYLPRKCSSGSVILVHLDFIAPTAF